MGELTEFRVHHVRLFDYKPSAIHNLAYSSKLNRLALSRGDGSLEIWNIKDGWFQEKIIPGNSSRSVEALLWQEDRLFTAGLDGDVTEYDLQKLQTKTSTSSNSGAIWCLTGNSSNNKLAGGTEDGCVVIFDTDDNSLQYSRHFDKQEGRILCIAWHAQEEIIVTGGVDNIRLWSVKAGRALQRLTLPGGENARGNIVWSVAITRDMTVVSGDSRGKTSFWNGKNGTLIRSFKTHQADVRCVCVNEEENCAFSSGVEPRIVQFNYVARREDSDWKIWTQSNMYDCHTHDVRALVCFKKLIVSGGVDTQLIYNNVVEPTNRRFIRRIPAIPQYSLVKIAKKGKLIMFQFNDYLDVWKLGHTNKTSDKNGEILLLRSNPVKLLQLKARDGETVITSAINSSGEYIAYSDDDTIRFYQLTFDTPEFTAPKVTLERLRNTSKSDILPAHLIEFTKDSSHLITATVLSTIQVLRISDQKVSLEHTFQSPQNSCQPVRLLDVSEDGQYVATSDCLCNINVYNLRTKQFVCHLPKYDVQACALRFSLHDNNLVVAHCDQKIIEYNVETQEYTRWCRENMKKFPKHWCKRWSKVTHISFNPRNSNQIFLSDEQMLCILDKTQQFPPSDHPLHTRSTDVVKKQPDAFHICNKYKYILHLDSLEDDWLCVVERTPMAITDAFPPPYKYKKFGT